jgi:putative DNA primase/helicase
MSENLNTRLKFVKDKHDAANAAREAAVAAAMPELGADEATAAERSSEFGFDAREAKRFLDALCGGECRRETFAWQTFGDGKKDRALAQTRSDTLLLRTIAELDRLNRAGAGVFVAVNVTDGRGRKTNNVTAVRALFVDLDGAPIEPVRAWGLQPHIIVESSPGKYHAYWRHDGSIALADFGRLQMKLAVKFGGDRSVTDLPRVMRLPGSWHQKGKPVQVRIANINDDAPAYSLADFEHALADVEVPERKPGKPKAERKPREQCSAAEWINQEALNRIGDWAPTLFPGGQWYSGAWRVSSAELGRPCQEDLAIHPDGIKDFGTQWDDHPADTYTSIRLLMAFFCEGEDGEPELVSEFDEYGTPQDGSLRHARAAELLAEALDFDWQELRREDAERAARDFAGLYDEEEPTSTTDDVLPPAFSEEALALGFANEHAGKLRYVAAWSKWYVWDGKQWRPDDTKLAFDIARKVCRKASRECNRENAAKTLASAKTVAAVERLATADRRLAATTDQWDADPWLLNTPGGVVDLRSGEIHPHRPTDYMTKITAVTPNGVCPLWRKFLNRIFAGDAELIAFVQRVAGYALTGSTREHALFFGFGTGANGKSVLINTISGILGDYHRTAAIETFTASKTERHPTDLAGLRGARLVTAIETEEGRRWDEAKIKALTGGDRIAARFMRQDFFEYVPAFKLMIAGNHKPSLRSVDESIRRRFNLLPFTVTIPPEERDRELPEKLKAEWPGIFRWMIQGCLEWQRVGLAPPRAVRDATAAYLEAEDAVGAWIEERCRCNPQAWESQNSLFSDWSRWAANAGEYVGTQRRFIQALETRGHRPERKRTARGLIGIELALDADWVPPAPGGG